MRLNFTLFSLLLLSCTVHSQKLTGIWRGYFSSSNGIHREGVRDEMYKYEIQIDQQSNNGLKGVTYSYKSTVFYGKAELQGILSLPAKSLIIRETKLIDLKIGDKSEPCLMTCYLDYSKMGKLEILEGTFISLNVKDKGDCGSGKVYLERVANSDFKKEDFLITKKTDTLLKNKLAYSPKPRNQFALTPKPSSDNTKPMIQPGTVPGKKDNPVVKNNSSKAVTPPQQKTIVPVPKKTTTTGKQPDKYTGKNKPVTKGDKSKTVSKPADKTDKPTTAKNNNPVVKDEKNVVAWKPEQRVQEYPVNSKKKDEGETHQTEITTKKIAVPKVLIERENNLVQTIITHEENIVVEFYDGGIIDNDTISVYHNNQLVVSNGRLTYSPITIKIKCSKSDNRHEIIVVAENLGDIPPNTALMVITGGDGKERHEITLASDKQRNAKVVIEYKPKQ